MLGFGVGPEYVVASWLSVTDGGCRQLPAATSSASLMTKLSLATPSSTWAADTSTTKGAAGTSTGTGMLPSTAPRASMTSTRPGALTTGVIVPVRTVGETPCGTGTLTSIG